MGIIRGWLGRLWVMIMDKKYNIIYADPPWSYGGSGKGCPEKHYQTMDTIDICKFDVKSISDDDCLLFIWGTWYKLKDCLQVLEAWGFRYISCAFVWAKTNKNYNPNQGSFFPSTDFELSDNSFFGLGSWTRSNTEFCLLGKKGKPKRYNNSISQLVYQPLTVHSKKPDQVRDAIVKLAGDLPRLEMFCRYPALGWDVFGNEVEASINIERIKDEKNTKAI